jgi:hypothetical protein
MIYTTYNLAVKHNACERALESWDKHVGGIKKFGADTQIPLTDILDVLGIDDCLWALRTVKDQEAADIIATKFLTAIVDRTLIYFESEYPGDKRPRQAIEVLRAYLLNPSKETSRAVDKVYAETFEMGLRADDEMALRALLAGGDWINGANCGSRARRAVNYRWHAGSALGGRALSEAELKWQAATLKGLLEEVSK